MRTIVALLSLVLTAPAAGATEVEVSHLDAEAEAWNGQEVTVRGEIVGDYSPRGDEMWVQLNDDPYVDEPLIETGLLQGGNIALGVRMPIGMFSEEWGPVGGYHVRGPVVRVTGIFRYADPGTGGDTFLDATSIELVDPARPLKPPAAEIELLAAALLMMAIGVGLGARARWRILNPRE